MGPNEIRIKKAYNTVISENPTERVRTEEPLREAIEQVIIDDDRPERRVGIGSELDLVICTELMENDRYDWDRPRNHLP